MGFNYDQYQLIQSEVGNAVTIVAVSKFQPVESLQEAYSHGVRDFGENYVQELLAKYELLPKDIRWHFIGHLQSNKVKYIAPFVHLIQGVDSAKLLSVINKEAQKCNRKIACLIQVHIAEEETKFGFDAHELDLIKPENFPHVSIVGLMGMASFTSDTSQVEKEFQYLNLLYQKLQPTFPDFQYLSMGMSGDYALAVKNGSNMVRIGSALFGQRVSPKN